MENKSKNELEVSIAHISDVVDDRMHNLLLRTASVDSSRPTKAGRQLHYAGNQGPVIVWSVTKKCNLACSHCYIDAADAADSDELNTAEAHKLINDAATLHPPVVLFSGGSRSYEVIPLSSAHTLSLKD